MARKRGEEPQGEISTLKSKGRPWMIGIHEFSICAMYAAVELTTLSQVFSLLREIPPVLYYSLLYVLAFGSTPSF